MWTCVFTKSGQIQYSRSSVFADLFSIWTLEWKPNWHHVYGTMFHAEFRILSGLNFYSFFGEKYPGNGDSEN